MADQTKATCAAEKTNAQETKDQTAQAQNTEAKSETTFDALLKSALLETLLQEEQEEPKTAAQERAEEEHVFSPAFHARMQHLIEAAGKLPTVDGNADSRHTVLSAAQLSDRRSARAVQREKAKAAEARQFERLHLRRGQRMLVNAASLLLIFGLGIIALKELRTPLTEAGTGSAAAVMGALETGTPPLDSARAIGEEPAPAMAAMPENAKERAATPRTFSAEVSGNEVTGNQQAVADGNQQAGAEQPAPAAASIANPVEEVGGPEAFSETLGFSLTAEDEAQHTALRYSIISGEIAQIQYHCERLQSDVTLRAARETEALTDGGQIAGVYDAFDEARKEDFEIEKDGQTVQAKLQFVKTAAPGESAGALATWKAGDLIYSLWVEDTSHAADTIETEVKQLMETQV